MADDTMKTMGFVDRGLLRERGIGRSGLERFYRELVHHSHLLAGLEPAQLQGTVSACDATCYMDADPVSETFIKVGEAAFAIDPLSSTGVQKAMQSSLTGSVVANTLLTGTGDGAAAVEFYRESLRYTVEQHAMWAGEYYYQNSSHRCHPFWSTRAKEPSPSDSMLPSRTLQELLAHRVILSAAASIQPGARIAGNIVERSPLLYHPNLARPVAYLDGVEVATLLKPLELGITLNEILTIWATAISPNRALAIASWLNRRGIIVPV
jgi:hypothetical protein